MQKALVRRSQIIKKMRDYFAQRDFIDVETPILGRSTPEGARDYLVPSRVHGGHFYALPQSPQLYKQILMVAGFDRYVQVAKCFRDEDLRADRQPEFTQLEFRVFRGTADAGNFVRGMRVPGGAKQYSRRQIDALTEFVKEFGAKGLAWFRVEDDGSLFSPIAKNFEAEHLAEIKELLAGTPGDLLVFLADTWETTCKGLYALRKRFGAEMKLYDDDALNCSWITEFPMFDKDEETGNWHAMHHPFTAPLVEDLPKLESDPAGCRAQAYDLVINGSEAGGGTIRIHDSEIQSKVFGLLGIDEQTAEDRFGFLLNALRFGAPPHGGIALGVDRWVMLFAGLENIREVIAFPKTQKASDLMTDAPGEVDAAQLTELYLKTTVKK
jgi:aspartyl-tRNA synthetase